MAQPDRRTLRWDHGTLEMQRLGAMLGPVEFRLPGGRIASPLHVAPWADEPEAAMLPGILRRLRGEWPCVPFGYPMPADGFPPEWAAVMPSDEVVEDVHGFSANHEWGWLDDDGRSLRLACDYPAGSPVRRLERTVTPDPDAPAIDLTLTISVREPCRLPLGLHPVFRLPDRPGAVELVPGRFAHVRTHPSTVEPGASLFAPNRLVPSLTAVPTRDGGSIDASRLPLTGSVEELLQLDGTDGSFAILDHDAGHRTRLSWDPAIFPSVLLWLSNRGRQGSPWNGRHLAVGIEPVCSPFGLGPATAAADNPIARAGTPTCMALDPAAPLTTRYRLQAEAA